ncbi:hypothetical protein Tco_0400120 [Tanacetum coccineum]
MLKEVEVVRLEVWFQIRGFAGMDQIPSRFADIFAFLIPTSKGNSVVNIISRLLLADASYYIWIERNSRLLTLSYPFTKSPHYHEPLIAFCEVSVNDLNRSIGIELPCLVIPSVAFRCYPKIRGVTYVSGNNSKPNTFKSGTKDDKSNIIFGVPKTTSNSGDVLTCNKCDLLSIEFDTVFEPNPLVELDNLATNSKDEGIYEGLNRSPKQRKVRQVFNENHLTVCAILEFHVDVSVVYDTCKKVNVKEDYKAFVVETGCNQRIEVFAMFMVVKHLKLFKSPLRKLLKEQGNLHDRVNRLRDELCEMEAGFLLGNKSSKKSGLAAKSKPVGEAYSHSVEAGNKENSSTDYPKPTIVTPVTETIAPTDDTTMKPANRSEAAAGVNDDTRCKQFQQKKISDKFTNTLYGYFIGERLAFPTVEAYVKMLGTIERGAYFSEYLGGKYQDEKGDYVKGTCVGSYTQCACCGGRSSYARVLVELSSKCAAMETIVVAIPLPKVKGHYLETLEVEYEWWPPRCSKCKIFGHGDDACPSRVKKANSDSLEGTSGLCDDGAKLKKKGKNTAASKPGFRFTKPKNNLVYRPVSKPIAIKEKVSKPITTAPSLNEDVNEAVLQPKESPKVIMDNSYSPVNEHGYYKDDIDLEQLRGTMEKLMEENKVLDINLNTSSEGSGETMHSNPNDKGGLTTHVSAPAGVNVSVKGSLWEQFMKTHWASMSKHKSSITDSDESEVEEVCMPDVLPGGGFPDDLEDDLDCYDGYEDQVYDLPKKARDFCAQYDICLNSRHRKDPKADSMVRMVTNVEIQVAMFSIGDDKASGPNGYTAPFLKNAWDVVVKLEILSSMSFKEGNLPAKYRRVSLISSQLLYRDYKELVEKLQNLIVDWKNKFLSFVVRLQ